MNCLFLLVLLGCGGFGCRRTNGCITPREQNDCGCEERGEEADCGCSDRREERDCGCNDRRQERDCGCNDRRDDCNCDRRFAESRPMSRYDDSMRGCSMGDTVPEMGQQGRNQYAGYPEN